MAYTDLATLKNYIGTSLMGDDALLTAFITRAQAYLDLKTGRHFEAVTATKTFGPEAIRSDGQGLAYLALDHLDLLSVTTLTNGDGTVIPAAGFRLSPRNFPPYHRIYLFSSFAWSFVDDDDTISVAGGWGFSATAPLDVVEATVELAVYLYRRKDTSAGDQDRTLTSGDGIILLPSSLPQVVRDVIGIYKPRT